MLFPLAHFGHWGPDLAIFGSPVVIGFLAIKLIDRRERARDREDSARSSSSDLAAD